MKQKENNQTYKTCSVDILSVDNMGRIITTGGKDFDFGILLPQYILFDGCSIPLDASIDFMEKTLLKAKTLEVKPLRIIEKQDSKIAFVSINVNGVNELKKKLFSLHEGDLYKVTIYDENEAYYSVSVDDAIFRGYIEKTSLDKAEYNIGDSISARLYKVGKTPFDYFVFIPNIEGVDIFAVSDAERTEEEANLAFKEMFTDLEREIMPEEDVTFSKDILQMYPNTTRKDTFLNDLKNLYVRYDARLRYTIDNLNRIKPSYFADCVFWAKYYQNEDKECIVLFNANDLIINIVLESDELVIKNIFYNRTNKEAIKIMEAHRNACLKLDGCKLHIVNEYQGIPYSFNSSDALDYIRRMQEFHYGMLKDLKNDVIGYRIEHATDFTILKGMLNYQKKIEEENIGDQIRINEDSQICRSETEYYKSGVAFTFSLSSIDFNRLVNKSSEDYHYVAIVDQEGKPLRSGVLSYDGDLSTAKLEFPENRDIDSNWIRQGFCLKKRCATEHLQIQIDAINGFIKGRGKSFYDDLIGGQLPKPVITQEIENIEFYDENLRNASNNNNQPIAVKKALGNEKLVLVQGPPGTGKTTVIVEIIRQLVKQGKKVLVCSQAHAAVDNIVEKLQAIPTEEQHILYMSIGNEGEEESWGDGFSSEDYQQFLTNNKGLISLLMSGANETTAEELIGTFEYKDSISKKYMESHRYIAKYYNASKKLYTSVNKILDRMIKESNNFSYGLLESCRYQMMDVVLGTCVGIGMNRLLKRSSLHFDTVIIDEAAKANLAETLVPLSMGDRYVLVGDDKQLPPYSDSSIIDEFAKEPELKDFDYKTILRAVTTSLFEKIHNVDSCPEECITMLNYQYRMHPDIGNFISAAFYEGKVYMGKSTITQQLPLSSPYTKQILFIDTFKGDVKTGGYGSYERIVGNSFCNDLECDIICNQILPKISEEIDLKKYSVGVITPYSGQRDLLRHNIKDVNLKRCVYTIDSIQGREFDVVIFSFVRAFKPSSGRKVGFLDDMRRLNVSLSRAKKKLILVGNKRTLTSPESHADHVILGVKPHEIFEKLSKESMTFTNKTKAEIFDQKYEVGDIIPCTVTDISDGIIGFVFKNDNIFYYHIRLHNMKYIEDIKENTCINIEFESRDENRKPLFEIVSFINDVGKTVNIENIYSYANKYPVGAICTVTVTGRDSKGDIRVVHDGFSGKIPHSSYPKGYLDHIVAGNQLNCRVFYVDIERQIVSFFPLFEEDILAFITSGEIKNFYCKVLDKSNYNRTIKLEFDSGEIEAFTMYHPWFDYLSIGQGYTQIGYSVEKNMMFFYQDIKFKKFYSRFAEGDVHNGRMVYNNGKYAYAIIADYPCSVIEGSEKLIVGQKYEFKITHIDANKKTVDVNLSTNDKRRNYCNRKIDDRP